MTRTRWTLLAARSTVLGGLLIGFATLAIAQQSKPAGPPISSKGAVMSSPKADKGQATAEAKRTAAADRKVAKNADKLQNTEQRSRVLTKAKTQARHSTYALTGSLLATA